MIIKTEKLSKIYSTEEVETTAINNINLTVEKGEFVSIMGPSGCGKSTLLNVLGLLDRPTRGNYFFDGKNISQLKNKERAELRKLNIGFVFQSFNLIDELSVYENIELPLIYLKKDKKYRERKTIEIMERMGIRHRKNHFPQQLSGGQQQRVGVARALISEPQIIFADEPTGNLDSSHGNEVMNLLTDLNESGTSIVMVTHSPHDASFSHRIIRLLDGHMVTESANNIDHQLI